MESLTKQIKSIVNEHTTDDEGYGLTKRGTSTYRFYWDDDSAGDMMDHLLNIAKKRERELKQKLNGTDPESMKLYRFEQKQSQVMMQYLYDHLDDLGAIRCHAEDIEAILGYIDKEKAAENDLCDEFHGSDTMTSHEFYERYNKMENNIRMWRNKIDSIKACHKGIDVVKAWKMCPPNYIAMAEQRGVCVMG